MSTRTFLVSEELGEYIDRTWPESNPVLAELKAETAKMVEGNMQISADQGMFFQVLLKAIGARKALEVGVFTGYSSSVTAMSLPSDGQLIACDVSEEYTSVARKYWEKLGLTSKIELRIGPALQTLATIGQEGHVFDFAFIDADKPNYWNYFDAIVPMMRKNGVIAIDNVLWSGRVADPTDTDEQTGVIRDFNRRVSEDKRVLASLMPIGDGVTLCVKL